MLAQLIKSVAMDQGTVGVKGENSLVGEGNGDRREPGEASCSRQHLQGS